MSAAPDLVRPSLQAAAARLGAFVAERYPLAADLAIDAFASASNGAAELTETTIERIRTPFRSALAARLSARAALFESIPDTTPGVAATSRYAQACDELLEACDGHLRREALARSITPDEKRELLRGMILTRATDNRLKKILHERRDTLWRRRIPGEKASDRLARRRSTAPSCVCAVVPAGADPMEDGAATSLRR